MTAQDPTSPEVAIGNGLIRGAFSAGVYNFKGIPYAATIEGINRWLPPKPPAAFTGTFAATRYGPSAPQKVPSAPEWLMPKAGAAMMKMMGGMSDPGPDCLSLNVWTPAEPSGADEKLPVMVWIHGGGLASGGSSLASMDGTRLAKRGNVVVVSVNYRLGGIGFLAGDGLFDDDVCAGNRGFMDVVAALKWVQDNVGQFGGDPRECDGRRSIRGRHVRLGVAVFTDERGFVPSGGGHERPDRDDRYRRPFQVHR